MKKTIFFILLSIFTLSLDGENLKLVGKAPSEVEMNTPFQLTYSISSRSVEEFTPPKLDNFEIVGGPFQASEEYKTNFNGKVKKVERLTITYTLLATEKGTFKIPNASIVANGKKILSNSLQIKVVKNSTKKEGLKEENDFQNKRATPQTADKNSIFVKTIVSKKNVYLQEPILLTYKLYTLLDVDDITIKKLPNYEGFLTQNVDQVRNRRISYEKLNGRNYGTVVLYQIVLYPQKSGRIKVDNMLFDALLTVRTRQKIDDIFEDYFDTYTNVKKVLVAPKTTISVSELPTLGKPDNFSGGVGEFNIKSELSKNELKTNEATTLKINVSGVGNLKFISTPKVNFPDDFEVYEPKVEDNFQATSNGTTGEKVIEYTFIPRRKGVFEIPAVEFSYFDLKTKAYKTIKTTSYNVEVEKGKNDNSTSVVAGNYMGKEEVKNIAKDIYFIHTDRHKLQTNNAVLLGTSLFWVLFITPLLLAIVVFIFMRKRVKENSNLVLVRNKRANKEARKRLKQAKIFLEKENKSDFYMEIMNAIRVYLSDKFTIATSEMNRDTIREKMLLKSVDNVLIDRVFEMLDKCEYANYAPLAEQEEIGDIYNQTVMIVSELEQTVKRK